MSSNVMRSALSRQSVIVTIGICFIFLCSVIIDTNISKAKSVNMGTDHCAQSNDSFNELNVLIKLLHSVHISPERGIDWGYMTQRWVYAHAIREWSDDHGGLPDEKIDSLISLLNYRDVLSTGELFLTIAKSQRAEEYLCTLNEIFSRAQLIAARSKTSDVILTSGGIRAMATALESIKRNYRNMTCN